MSDMEDKIKECLKNSDVKTVTVHAPFDINTVPFDKEMDVRLEIDGKLINAKFIRHSPSRCYPRKNWRVK